MKRALSIFTLCLLLITGCTQQPVTGVSASSSANSKATSSSEASAPVLKEGDYEYKIEAGSVTIVKYNGTAENVTIPDTIVGLSVKVIGESAFQENATLKTIKISDNVMIIGDSAFSNCEELESVELGKSVEEIGAESFLYCPNLEQVKMNNRLKIIGDQAFDTCSNLKSLILPDSVVSMGMGAFFQAGITDFKFPKNIKEISDAIFSSSDLKTVTLPEKVEIIGTAFAYTRKITEIFIPDSVISIKEDAFEDCSRELVLLYDNNPLVPKFAEEHNILCFKRSEYSPVLTVELVNGKPLNDDKNQGISSADYNLIKRQSSNDLYKRGVSNDYICFYDDEDFTDEAVKAKLTKTAALLYQCGITDFDPSDISNANSDHLDSMATFAIYSRSKDEIGEDKKELSGVVFVKDSTFYSYYKAFFGVDPEFSKITGYSKQQKGIWYYLKEFPKAQAELLSYSYNKDKDTCTLKLRFTPKSGSPIEKTLSFKFTYFETDYVEQYQITLTGMK